MFMYVDSQPSSRGLGPITRTRYALAAADGNSSDARRLRVSDHTGIRVQDIVHNERLSRWNTTSRGSTIYTLWFVRYSTVNWLDFSRTMERDLEFWL